MLKSIFLFLGCTLFGTAAFAQGVTIQMNNPSFEDQPRTGKAPNGWYDCGWNTETPPDVNPIPNPAQNAFKVIKKAKDGGTYLGMVVRDNDTWERVGQRLSTPLEGGKCYEFSIYLSRSELYESQSRITQLPANYTTPAKLRIWGGNGYCDRREMLAESGLVINTRWLKFDFRFEPKQDMNYIMFEAYYKTPTLFPYNGNVLLDGASAIVQVPCSADDPMIEDPIVAEAEAPLPEADPTPAPTPEPERPPLVETIPERPAPAVPAETLPPAPVRGTVSTLGEYKREELQVGTTVRIDKLYFPADQSNFKPESKETLDKIYSFLSQYPEVQVEIGGHTNTVPAEDYCLRLSTDRAQSVVNYLIQRGVPEKQLIAKGYGKSKPIARNDRYNMQARKKNQRVEVKILSFGEQG